MQVLEEKINFHNRNVGPVVKSTSSIISWIKFIIPLLLVFIVIRFLFGITIIDGNSMNPTLENRNVILTSNLFYKVERNDIVIVKNPDGFNIIKRVIAFPGETIKIEKGIVYINGKQQNEPYTVGKSNNMPEIKLEKGFYFIMRDNRTPGESLDSRSVEIGPIARNLIVGKMMVSIIPFGIR